MPSVYLLRANCPVCHVTLRTDRIQRHLTTQHPIFPRHEIHAINDLVEQVIASNPGKRIAFDLRSMRAELLDHRQTLSLFLPSVMEIKAVIEATRKLTPDLLRHLRHHSDDLLLVPSDVFEHLVAELLASMGFEDVALIGASSATAADIFAAWRVHPLGLRVHYFVEVKRWKDRVGIEVIDRVQGAMLAERPTFGWHAAMIVSVSGFCKLKRDSVSELRNRGIELKDRTDLDRWLKEYQPTSSGLWLPGPSYKNGFRQPPDNRVGAP